MFLIGSRAADYWTNRKFYRAIKDWDIVGTRAEFDLFILQLDGRIKTCYPSSPIKYQIKMNNYDKIEFELIEPGSSNELLGAVCDIKRRPVGTVYYENIPLKVVPLVTLYLIKRSHIYWNVHWKKTIEDLHWLKKQSSNEVLETLDRDFYTRRIIEASKKYGKALQAQLGTDNKKFFARSEKRVKRVFLHDDLHEVVKFGIRPIYELAKNDPTKAIMNKVRFDKLPEHMKHQAVQEEAAVIALERKLVPLYMGNIEPNEERIRGAYDWALMRICTNLTSGWFRDFAINSWPTTKDPGQHFFKRFLDAYQNERLERIEDSEEMITV